MSRPPTVVLSVAHVSSDGQQSSPGKHLQDELAAARQMEGAIAAQRPETSVDALMLILLLLLVVPVTKRVVVTSRATVNDTDHNKNNNDSSKRLRSAIL